jgi:hypothetical protein
MLEFSCNWRNIVENHFPSERIDHALFLTYGFDGVAFEDEEIGPLESIFQRECKNVIVIRDAKQVVKEKGTPRYSVYPASFTKRTYHPKLMVLLSSVGATVVIGSANLTKGGMRHNLELASEHRLGRGETIDPFFHQLLEYIQKCVSREIADHDVSSVRGFEEFCNSFETFLAVFPRASPRGKVQSTLFHNYDKPLFDQVFDWGEKRIVEELLVLSPFFDPTKLVPEDEPDEGPPEHDLLQQISTRIAPSRTRFFVEVSDNLKTSLPVNDLHRLCEEVEVYGKNHSGVDSRRLHAKMLLVQGKTK